MVAEEIKKERERFVAFAFAAAEIFFEIDHRGHIVFEGGASARLAGDKNTLVGTSFSDIVHQDDREFLNAMMSHLGHKGRMGPLPLRFVGRKKGKDLALRLFALQMPSAQPRTFISLRSAPLSGASSDNNVDAATGLFDKDNFLEMAAKTMQDESGGGLFVTAVQVDGLRDDHAEKGKGKGENLLKRIAAHMKSLAVDGTAAGQIAEDKFAFVHRGKNDGAHLRTSLKNADSAIDARATTLKADSDVSESEVLRTLSYVLQQFIEDPENCNFDGLASAYDQLAKETSTKMLDMRATIAAGNFKMVFQPVVRLENRDISHHEVLSRFDEARGEAPADIFKFVEDVGLIEEFDIALTMKSIDYIRKMKRLGTPLTLALNISGRSLDVGRLGDQLVDCLMQAKDVARNIILELTETKVIQNLEKVEQILAQLKTIGYRICLDDFGAGASGYQYLRVFNVDMVKIEGSYISEMNMPDYRPTFLLSMVRLCEDLKVDVIGEHIETQFQSDFLKSLGAKYGQGYFFGRPTVNPQTRV